LNEVNVGSVSVVLAVNGIANALLIDVPADNEASFAVDYVVGHDVSPCFVAMTYYSIRRKVEC
jgi:hypothetical protein